MATKNNALSGFDDMESDLTGPAWDDDQYTGNPEILDVPSRTAPVATPLPSSAVVDAVDVAEAKGLLDIRGFYVASGEGIYDGAIRDDEEPRESYFVDVQDYETGLIERVWGVALNEVMSQAQATLNLQPGSRIHLSQRGKRPMVLDSVNAANEMVIRQTMANDWICMADRGPLPSQLAHLMAGVNVDALLDRLALRHDMGLDDPRLADWKAAQTRIVKGFGDDPQTIKGWFARQTGFSADEERALVVKALELEGYGADEPERLQREIESRLQAIRSMGTEARFDYLIETAKPHLLAGNKQREAALSHEVVDAIDDYSAMVYPTGPADSPERKAMKSSLIQSIDGLTPTQQADYLAFRRTQLLQQKLATPLAPAEVTVAGLAVSKDAIIDASKLSRDEYQALLEQKLALATTSEEREAMLAEEIKARQQEAKDADARFAPINAFYQKIVADRDIDMTALLAGRVVSMLADVVTTRAMPHVKTLFHRLGGVGSWRRRGCEDGLADLQGALAETKATAVYQAFENDPKVRAACGGQAPGQVLAAHPEVIRTDVVMEHLRAQESADSPTRTAASPRKGLWAKTMDSAHALSDRISHLAPEHLIKDGKIDVEWVNKMQKGLAEFAGNLKETLMPENLMKEIQEMIASMLQMIKLMMEMARELFSGKSAAAPVELGM